MSALTLGFLARNHSFVPMWVEGMGVCLQADLSMLGYDKQPVGCSLRIGKLSLPLSINSHEGPAWIYLYAAPIYLYFSKITTDPYAYRYLGILLFLANAWILYYLLTKYYKPSLSFYSAAAFLTNPVLLLGGLTDFGTLEQTMMVFILLTLLLFSHYIKGRSSAMLLASAMTLGMTLLVRTEVLIWPIIPFSIYLLLARPALVLDRWRQTKRKPVVAVAALVMACVGASPVIAYNLVCPEFNIFHFTVNTVFPSSFESMSLWERLLVRADQFWSFNILNTWPWFELRVPNYVMAALWIMCACILSVRWVRQRKPSLFLIVAFTTVVLSILTTGRLRSEALTVLEPATLLVITSALAYLETPGILRKVVHVAFIALIVGNIAVGVLDWRGWNELPSNSQTMLNQSDPELLASYLSEHHASDHILYTNVGMPQYVQYMTLGKLKGDDIIDWTSDNGFIRSVKLSLLAKSRKRVFVAVAKEHDGLSGSKLRTKLLYAILNQYNVPYEVTSLSNERNQSLYELAVVNSGDGLSLDSAMGEALLVSDVLDVRVAVQPDGERLVIGSIVGAGFKPGDTARVNGDLIVPTIYGNDAWITFSMPLEVLGNRRSFTLDVFRIEGLERSKTFSVSLPQ